MNECLPRRSVIQVRARSASILESWKCFLCTRRVITSFTCNLSNIRLAVTCGGRMLPQRELVPSPAMSANAGRGMPPSPAFGSPGPAEQLKMAGPAVVLHASRHLDLCLFSHSAPVSCVDAAKLCATRSAGSRQHRMQLRRHSACTPPGRRRCFQTIAAQLAPALGARGT